MVRRLIGRAIIGFISLFLCNGIMADEESANQPSAKFISVADIHFDPFYDCEKYAKSCDIINKLNSSDYHDWHDIFEKYSAKNNSTTFDDTNYSLLKSTLLELQDLRGTIHPRFVIILGDFLGHDYRSLFKKYSEDKSNKAYEVFVKKTFQFLTLEFNKIFSDIDVYPVVGNNDSYNGNYRAIPGGIFFQEMAVIWSQLIKDKTNQNLFRQDFPTAGYYLVNIPGSQNLKMIILNTVLFSNHSRTSVVQGPAHEQLEWLDKQLRFAVEHHQKVILGYHIPVGVDVYATMKTKFSVVKEFWQTSYTEKFEAKLKEYNSSITEILSAHIHIDTLQLVAYRKLSGIPVVITPSISPIYGNNPGFKVFTYNTANLQVEKIQSYYYQINLTPAVWSWKAVNTAVA